MILDWRLPPGSVLSEHQLALQLGVSRTPVREAIGTLRRDGLVRSVPGESAIVAELSIREIVENHQMRMALESFAARLAAANPRSRDFLGQVYEDMKQARKILKAGDIEGYHGLSERADRLIAAAAENRYLAETLEAVWGSVARIRRIADVQTARLYDSVPEHVKILAAILAHDEDAAERSTREHLAASLAHVLRQLVAVTQGDLADARPTTPSPRKRSSVVRSRRVTSSSGMSVKRAASLRA